MKFTLIAAALASLAALLSYGAFALAAGSEPPRNWHVHDGQSALGPQHKGVGFFPAILGLTTAEYLQDPARCPDATDKVFLPNGKNDNQPLRAGHCDGALVPPFSGEEGSMPRANRVSSVGSMLGRPRPRLTSVLKLNAGRWPS